MIQLPSGATQNVQKVLDQVTHYYLNNEKANVEKRVYRKRLLGF